jgi:hypothetical protein
MSAERGRLSSLFERILRVYPEDFRKLFAEDMAVQFSRRCGGLSPRRSDPLYGFALRPASSSGRRPQARAPVAVGSAREAEGAAHS